MIEKFTPPEVSKKNDEEIFKELTSTGKISELIPAKEYNFAELSDELQQLTKSGLESIEKYLGYPTIIDNFTKHTKRRKWRHSLSRDSGEMYDKNTLRSNNIGATLNAVDFVILEPKWMDLFKEEKESLLKEFLVGWACDERNPDGMFTTEEKIKFIENKLKPFLLRVREAIVG